LIGSLNAMTRRISYESERIRLWMAISSRLSASISNFQPHSQTVALLPSTIRSSRGSSRPPFIHRPGDDDSSAVTFWGKRDLRVMLRKALEELDKHYEARAKAH
jgi:hypothetical protein